MNQHNYPLNTSNIFEAPNNIDRASSCFGEVVLGYRNFKDVSINVLSRPKKVVLFSS